MEIPSPTAGVVKEIKVKVGDKITQGAAILMVEEKRRSAPDKPRAGEQEKENEKAQEHGAEQACTCLRAGRPVTGARHRRFQGSRGDRGAGQAGRHGGQGAVADHGRVGQGDDGNSFAGRRRGEGNQGQGRRQGVRRQRRCWYRVRAGRAAPVQAGQAGACRAPTPGAAQPPQRRRQRPSPRAAPEPLEAASARGRMPALRCASSRASSAST